MFATLLLCVLGLTNAASESAHMDAVSRDMATLRHRVKHMENLLIEQQRIFLQLDKQLQKQATVIHNQDALLSAQDISLHLLNERLARQEGLLAQQTESMMKLEFDMSRCISELRRFEKLNLLQMASNTHRDVKTENIKAKHGRDSTNYSKSQNVSKIVTRADDAGPLEVVINQLSQQVTGLGADLQAMQNTFLRHDAEIQALVDRDDRQDSVIREAGSSTFIRWGSSLCPNSSELVYSGTAGGSPYTETGAATNYLCLTMSPVPSDVSMGGGANLYGVEYENGGASQDMDAVCSVCRSSLSTTIMIPGTNVCTAGWQLQYSGYLMAGASLHNAGSEFICVDASQGSRPGSEDDHNGKLLFAVQARCGSLPCEPYVAGEEVTCAVCSK